MDTFHIDYRTGRRSNEIYVTFNPVMYIFVQKFEISLVLLIMN